MTDLDPARTFLAFLFVVMGFLLLDRVVVHAAGPAGAAQLPSPAIPLALTGLRVTPSIREVAGYDRSCSPGHRCAFGPAWTDDNTTAWGHDGCDTRNQVLAAQLVDVQLKPGTRGCVVAAGTLHDPYSAQVVALSSHTIQIDHVFPLAAAWSAGADLWPLATRVNFANDPRNLVATTQAMNGNRRGIGKGDQTPGSWMPPTRPGQCLYAQRYVAVATAYNLAVTPADRDALAAGLATCTARAGQAVPDAR